MGTTRRFKLAFGSIVLGVVFLSGAGVLLRVRGLDSPSGCLALVLGGLLLLGTLLFLLIDRTVFRPAFRLRLGLSRPEGPLPSEGAGFLEPLARAVEERLGREREAFEERIRTMEETLRQVEALRRDNEETRAHLEAKVQDLQSIYEIATAVAGTLDMEEIFRIIPERIRGTMGLKDFCLLLYDPEIRMLTCRASAGMAPDVAAEIRFAPGEGVSGRVFETGEPVYIPDVRSSPEFLYYGGRRTDVRSFMSVPLLSKGRAIGVMNVNHTEPSAFDAESLATMRVLATHMAIAIENADLFRFVRTLAEKDSLTLLYNHGAFHEKLQVELERASRYGRPLAVMMLDLDNFKSLNDTCGHLVGDRVLVMTAGVLCAHLRKSDIPARYGGDEFAVVLPETDLEAASAIASRIVAGMSQVRVETGKGEMIAFSVSIGYAACRPDSRNRQAILSVADRLMYESKRRGRGGVLGEQL